MPASGLRRRAEVSASHSLEEALALPGGSKLQAAQGPASPALHAWQAAPLFLGQQFLDFLPVQRRGEFLLAADGRLDDLDRKSTRLNSSHSLPDALPICLTCLASRASFLRPAVPGFPPSSAPRRIPPRRRWSPG